MNTKDAQKLHAVIRRNVITMDEISRIRKIGDQRAGNDDKMLRADGHSVSFLQKDGLFEELEPKLLDKIVSIMKETDGDHWKLISNEVEDAQNVNVRVIEYHHYIKGGGLVNKYHSDGGSIVTMVCMLSDPLKDFEGGTLQTWECNEEFMQYDVRKGDMIVFPSHKFHSVSPVTQGERFVLVMELWEGPKSTDDFRTGGFSHLIPSMGMINGF